MTRTDLDPDPRGRRIPVTAERHAASLAATPGAPRNATTIRSGDRPAIMLRDLTLPDPTLRDPMAPDPMMSTAVGPSGNGAPPIGAGMTAAPAAVTHRAVTHPARGAVRSAAGTGTTVGQGRNSEARAGGTGGRTSATVAPPVIAGGETGDGGHKAPAPMGRVTGGSVTTGRVMTDPVTTARVMGDGMIGREVTDPVTTARVMGDGMIEPVMIARAGTGCPATCPTPLASTRTARGSRLRPATARRGAAMTDETAVANAHATIATGSGVPTTPRPATAVDSTHDLHATETDETVAVTTVTDATVTDATVTDATMTDTTVAGATTAGNGAGGTTGRRPTPPGSARPAPACAPKTPTSSGPTSPSGQTAKNSAGTCSPTCEA